MENVKLSIKINAPVQKVFDFLTNPNNIPLVLPGLIENTNIPQLPLKAGDKFDFKYKMIGVVVEGVTVVDKIESPASYHFSTSAGLVSHWREQFSPEGDATKIILEVDYDTPKSVTDKIIIGVARKFNLKEAERYLQNIQLALELN